MRYALFLLIGCARYTPDETPAPTLPTMDTAVRHDDTGPVGSDDTSGTVDLPPDTAERDTAPDSDADSAIHDTSPVDTDADGYPTPDDCDDTDASVFPGAPERCNLLDDDCDGTVDLGAVDRGTWYADVDADTYGDPNAPVTACEQPAGTVEDATDCDDTRASVNPGAVEVPGNDLDDDCDLKVDTVLADAVSGWTVLGTDGDALGDALLIAPDLDGSGYDDLIIGAMSPNSGAIGFLDARHAGADVAPDSGWAAVTGSTSGDYFGAALAEHGGRVLVGAPGVDRGGTDAGAVYLLEPAALSGTTGVDAVFTSRIGSTDASASFGSSLAFADLDADGAVDLWAGAPGALGGQLFAFTAGWEATDDTTALATVTLVGEKTDDAFGASFAVADLDGDGLVDLVACAPDNDTVAMSAGACYLVANADLTTGSVATLASGAVYGDAADDGLGAAVATGDTDGDGTVEVYIGAPGSDAATPDGGVVVGLHGLSGSRTRATADVVFEGGSALGAALRVADVDEDGAEELLVSATGEYSAVYLLPTGLTSGTWTLPGDDDGAWESMNPGDGLGAALAAPWDLDADGAIELVMSAPGHDGAGTERGRVYVLETR